MRLSYRHFFSRIVSYLKYKLLLSFRRSPPGRCGARRPIRLDCWPARESPQCGFAYISALRGDNGRSKCPPGSRSSSSKFLWRCQSLVLIDESYEVGSAEDGTVLLEVKRQVVARLALAHVIVQEVLLEFGLNDVRCCITQQIR